MTLNEFAEIINKDYIIYFIPGRKEPVTGKPIPYYCQFKDCNIKDDGILIGSYGNGKTPEEAIQNYCKNIKGKTIVFNAFEKEYRQVFNVPESLNT